MLKMNEVVIIQKVDVRLVEKYIQRYDMPKQKVLKFKHLRKNSCCEFFHKKLFENLL